MNPERKTLITLRRIAITLSVILGVLQVILLGWTLQRNSAIKTMATDRVILEENLSQLEQINQDQLDDLQLQLQDIQDQVKTLKESFPALGSPYPLFRRALTLANSSGVGLQSIELVHSETRDTIAGPVLVSQYLIAAEGTQGTCLDFVQTLEDAGADTLLMDSVNILPAELKCSFELSTVGLAELNP